MNFQGPGFEIPGCAGALQRRLCSTDLVGVSMRQLKQWAAVVLMAQTSGSPTAQDEPTKLKISLTPSTIHVAGAASIFRVPAEAET